LNDGKQEIGTFEATPQAQWPVIKRNGPKASTAIHGPLGFKYQPLEKSTSFGLFRKSVHTI
jgi:hypothetical protein